MVAMVNSMLGIFYHKRKGTGHRAWWGGVEVGLQFGGMVDGGSVGARREAGMRMWGPERMRTGGPGVSFCEGAQLCRSRATHKNAIKERR